MANLQKMRDERNQYTREYRNVLEVTAESEWSDEHKSKCDELIAKIGRIDDRIAAHEKLLDIEAEKKFEEIGGGIQDVQDNAAKKAIDEKFIRKGIKGFGADEWLKIQNTNQTLSTAPESAGGYTIQSDVASTIIESLKAFGGMRQVASQLSTSKGNPLNFPTSDYTTEMGEIVAENQPASDLDPIFGTVPIGAFKYSSKVITFSYELLQDTQVDVIGYIRRVIESRLARIQNQHFTRGGGTSLPFGVVTRATNSNVAVNTTTGITYEDIIDLQHSVDPAYRTSARLMFNDNTLKELRKLVDQNGRPIWTPSYDLGIQGGVPSQIAGMPYTINQDVLDFSGTNRFMVYGDLSKYLIRDVMGMTLFRFDDSVYVKRGQVGFLAWMRADGNLLDTGAVKYAAATGS